MAAKSTERTARFPPLSLLAMIMSLICTAAIITNAIPIPELVSSAILDNNDEAQRHWFGPIIHSPISHLIFASIITIYCLYRTRLLKQRNAQLERASTQVHVDLDMSRQRNAAVTRQNIRLKTRITQFEKEEKERSSGAVQRLLDYLEEKAQEKNFEQLEADLAVANERIDELSYLLATLDPSAVWTDLCREQGMRAEAQAVSNKLWQDTEKLRAQLASRDSDIEILKDNERQSVQSRQAELADRDGEIRRLKEDIDNWEHQSELRGYKKLVLCYGTKAFMLKNRWLQAKNQYLAMELKRFTGLYLAECKSRRNWQASWHKLVFDASDTENEDEV